MLFHGHVDVSIRKHLLDIAVAKLFDYCHVCVICNAPEPEPERDKRTGRVRDQIFPQNWSSIFQNIHREYFVATCLCIRAVLDSRAVSQYWLTVQPTLTHDLGQSWVSPIFSDWIESELSRVHCHLIRDKTVKCSLVELTLFLPHLVGQKWTIFLSHLRLSVDHNSVVYVFFYLQRSGAYSYLWTLASCHVQFHLNTFLDEDMGQGTPSWCSLYTIFSSLLFRWELILFFNPMHTTAHAERTRSHPNLSAIANGVTLRDFASLPHNLAARPPAYIIQRLSAEGAKPESYNG